MAKEVNGMPKITAERLRVLLKLCPKSVCQILGDALRDFGYSVTNDWVEKEVKRLLDGEQPRGGPSILLATWLEEGIE